MLRDGILATSKLWRHAGYRFCTVEREYWHIGHEGANTICFLSQTDMKQFTSLQTEQSTTQSKVVFLVI
jgi:hypothetical protein